MFPTTLALLLMAAAPDADCRLDISHAQIGDAPPSARVRAGYASLHNPGSEAVVIRGASSPAFGAVEIHEMFEKDGMMRMRPLKELVVPAGETVELERGGLHFMLFRPQVDTAGGIATTLTLDACGGLDFDIATIDAHDRDGAAAPADDDHDRH
ncbi:MAG: copper chaperone PCu(A)C [Lysobacteraceae bacterium]|jgi:copper(I)-binding protein